MLTSKRIDLLCLAAVLLAIALTVSCFGIVPPSQGIAMGYESRLFDTSSVHTIDITLEDRETFLATCPSEEYTACSVVIDGEAFKNVGIRGKGNTSLSSVSSMDSDRYSFKLEFDKYAAGGSYYGLDKLSLNNLIYDNTMMKDYLVYRMMQEFGANAPLCSYAQITINGEAQGLYLAVEGIEDSFLQRNYGNDHGTLYKPDSMNFGGGRGNGRNFNMEDFRPQDADTAARQPREMPEFGFRDIPKNVRDDFHFAENTTPDNLPTGEMSRGAPGVGAGSEDVKLQYIDDDPNSYSNIFDSAKTPITEADKSRLISVLKTLSADGNMENVVDIDATLRYFVVHNYAVNGDSYTGSMVHNYYLYEKNGQLSMLPWDYNLAFGTFQSSDAQRSVNDPIDTPMSTGSSDRPMIDWILENEGYLDLYHQYFSQFLTQIDIQAIINRTAALLDSHVQSDPTKFCTYEEFQAGVETLKEFCNLRSESIRLQLDGSIPSTLQGQQENTASLIKTDLNISHMGSMGGAGGLFDKNDFHKQFSMEQALSPEQPQPTPNNTSMDASAGPQFQPPTDFVPQTNPFQNKGDAWGLLGICLSVLIIASIFAACCKRRR